MSFWLNCKSNPQKRFINLYKSSGALQSVKFVNHGTQTTRFLIGFWEFHCNQSKHRPPKILVERFSGTFQPFSLPVSQKRPKRRINRRRRSTKKPRIVSPTLGFSPGCGETTNLKPDVRKLPAANRPAFFFLQSLRRMTQPHQRFRILPFPQRPDAVPGNPFSGSVATGRSGAF